MDDKTTILLMIMIFSMTYISKKVIDLSTKILRVLNKEKLGEEPSIFNNTLPNDPDTEQ